MAAIRTKGGEVLNKYILAKIFAFDDSASDARARSRRFRRARSNNFLK